MSRLGSLAARSAFLVVCRPSDAPPGTYLLFVIDSAGVPSVGRIVRIEPAA